MKSHQFLFLILGLTLLFACENKSVTQESIVPVQDSIPEDKEPLGLQIAFIYGDTINTKYNFLIDAQAELEQEEKTIQERLERKLRKAEQRAAELQQQAPTMTQAQMQEAQLELQGLDIEMQRFQEKLTTDFRKRELELQKDYIQRVDSFLSVYNADGQFDFIMNYQQGGNLIWVNSAYDITKDVLDGLNEAYVTELASKESQD